MSESGFSGTAAGTGLIDPCPGEAAELLDVMIAAVTDLAPEELEPGDSPIVA